MAVQVPDSQGVEDDSTRLPLLHTWPAVYGFVAVIFVLWVSLLTLLARAFS